MLETARRLELPENIIESGFKALNYAIAEFIRPYGGPDILCLVDEQKIKLGGSGLALIAVASAQRINPDEHKLKLALGLGRYLTSQRKSNGDFIHGRQLAHHR